MLGGLNGSHEKLTEHSYLSNPILIIKSNWQSIANDNRLPMSAGPGCCCENVGVNLRGGTAGTGAARDGSSHLSVRCGPGPVRGAIAAGRAAARHGGGAARRVLGGALRPVARPPARG